MRIKFLFYLLALFLIALGVWLAVYFRRAEDAHIQAYIMEGAIAFILIYLVVFYRRIVRPMNTISSGMELLREQDFSSRLSPVGQYESDRMVNIFNRMMDQLKNERLRLREQNQFLDLLIQASPMGVIITTLDNEVSQLNPVALKMLGIRPEEILGKRLGGIDSPLAKELASLSKEQTTVVRLTTPTSTNAPHSYFIDTGFKHPFFLIERMTEEVMRAEKRAYEKVIRMISHEVNNTTAGITSDPRHRRAGLGQRTRHGRHLRDDARMHRALLLHEAVSSPRFADVVKIPEPVPACHLS